MKQEIDVHALARAICDHLPGFEYVDDARQRNRDGELHWSAYLTSTAEVETPRNVQATVDAAIPWTSREMQFHVSCSHGAKGKLHVSLNTPHVTLLGKTTWLGDAIRREDTASVNVDPKRSAKAIAGDIARRLVPDATKQWATVLEWIAHQEAYAAEQGDACEEMRAMGATFTSREPGYGHFTFGDDTVAFRVNGTSVRFDYLSITTEQACRVLQALRGKP
jgi:hypothetical protein